MIINTNNTGSGIPLRKIALPVFFLFFSLIGGRSYAQEKKVLSVNEAVQLGIENSKTLKLSKNRIEEALSRYNQTKDEVLPKASASLMFNHAEFLDNQFQLPGSNEALNLPSGANAYIGTVSIEQLIFAGNKLKYAAESSKLLSQIAGSDSEKLKDDVVYAVINDCYNLYRIEQSQKVIKQNLEAVDKQIDQAQKFFNQGIVTKNDVLRFQLQRKNIELTQVDLETNRKVVNYNLTILLGLPENLDLDISTFGNTSSQPVLINSFIDSALTEREDIKQTSIRNELAEINIKNIKADLYPTVGVGGNLYYIKPSANPLPENNQVLAPVAVAASVKWNIDKLWTTKNKLTEARIQKSEALLNRELVSDNIKTEVNREFQAYLRSLDRVKILESSIEQAKENDRILESKYKNNIASVTDRIDAETQLYQALINLELAKADAGLAFFTLLKTSGTLKSNNL